MKRAFWRATTVAALLDACSAPTLDDMDPFARAANNTCPDGFFLYGDNQCSKKGPVDASVGDPDAGDASAGDAGNDATAGDAGDAAGKDATGLDGGDAAAGDGGTSADGADGASGKDASQDAAPDGAAKVGSATVTPTSGLVVSETGTTATFTVRLDTAPTANVTIPVASSKTSEAMVSPATLTFTPTNWSTPQTVTVTGVDDVATDGNTTWTIALGAATSTDPSYSGLDPNDVSGSTTDNDAPRVVVAPASGSTSESGTTFPFTVELSGAPAANVTIGVSSSNTAEGLVSPASLIFTPTNWSTKQTVTVTGAADGSWDGDKSYTVIFAPSTSADTAWNGIVGTPVAMTNVDIDVPIIKLVSVSTNTVAQGNGQSGGVSAGTSVLLGSPSVTTDGRSTFFASEATNLGNGDSNGVADIFRHEHLDQKTGLVSGTGLASWSGASTRPVTSGDGKSVIFHTLASSPTQPGCILHDFVAATDLQMSTSTSCVPHDINLAGRYAVFTEPVSGVTTLKRFDKTSVSSTTVTNLGSPSAASISTDGRYVTFLSTNAFAVDDTNGVADLYAVDMQAVPGIPFRVSTKSDGTQLATGASAGGISGDGNYFWFVTRDAAVPTDTDADADVYLSHRLGLTPMELASRMSTGGAVGLGDISNDGRHCAFEFTPSGGDKAIWVYDRVNQTNKSAHKTYNGGVPNGITERPSISGDGVWLTFVGYASNLVATDTNGKADVFIVPRP